MGSSNLKEMTKQAVLSRVDTDDKKKVLKEVKQNMEKLVTTLEAEEEEGKTAYWACNNKRGEYFIVERYPGEKEKERGGERERRDRRESGEYKGRSGSKSQGR